MREFFTAVTVAFLLSSNVHALCVLAPKAQLRKTPSLEAQLTLEAIPYTPLKKVSKKNGWYQVKDVDNKTHWVREELVTSHFQCVVIKTEFANLKRGPGPRFPKAGAGMGEKYLSFRFVDEKKDWIKVEDAEGDEAWIQKKNIWIQ